MPTPPTPDFWVYALGGGTGFGVLLRFVGNLLHERSKAIADRAKQEQDRLEAIRKAEVRLLDDCDKRVDNLEKRNESLSQQIDEHRRKYSDLYAENANLRAQNASQLSEIALLKNRRK